MAFSKWLLRCIPGLSLLVLLIFLECTLGIALSVLPQYLYIPSSLSLSGNHILLWIFAAYLVILHLASFYFPIRLCWAASNAVKKILETHGESYNDSDKLYLPVDGNNIKHLDLNQVEHLDNAYATMAIIIPSYKEDISTMEDTLSVLASHPAAKDSYHIFLAMEERDLNGETTAAKLLELFRDRFLRLQYTVHPADMPGEAPGKSSNVSWAAKEVERFYESRPECKNVLITTMDSDTHLLPQYFQYLRAAHARNRKSGYVTDMTLYMPPIVFDRNAHTVPRMVRIADLMWCAAGLSCFLPNSTPSSVGIPTAVYTIPLALAKFVHGWDTGPSAIGEDMHMMLKCYFATNGRMRIESVPSPASQCNITSEKHGIRGWFSKHCARYHQGLRHMWGCLDTGYAVGKWLGMGSEQLHQTDSTACPPLGEKPVTGRPRKLSHTELSLKLSQYALHGCEPCRWTLRNAVLFVRLFEAHFLPSHLLIMIVASAFYAETFRPLDDFKWISFLVDLTGYMRGVSYGIMLMYFFFIYERYHSVCVAVREKEMVKAGLRHQLSDQFSRRNRRHCLSWLDYILFPVAGTLFGCLCLVQAAFSHFYTTDLVYLVSAKPVRALLSASANVVATTSVKSESFISKAV